MNDHRLIAMLLTLALLGALLPQAVLFASA